MKGLDYIFEIGAEEIPAGYMAPALEALEERLTKALKDADLGFERIQTWATPLRIAFAVYGLDEKQEDAVKDVTGPPVRAAYDADGNPTKAAVGFAKGQGAEVGDLITVDTPKGEYIAVKLNIKGRSSSEVLREIVPPLILGLPFPKSMRWGRGEVVFVRPIHWIVSVLDGQVLPMSIGDIHAGSSSRGHRFLHPGTVEITSPNEYEEKLAAAHVHVSAEKRQELALKELDRVVAEADEPLKILKDEELTAEVGNLVEEPVAVLGSFDDKFLALPADILVTAMKEHQRYFALTGENAILRPYFIAVNNTRARDMNVVKKGHERVLRARLDDARFYFEEDRKATLESRQEELKRVVFHVKLGTSWQKVERFRKLADYLSDLLEPEVKGDLLRAAELCKCDLVSGVVGEFPVLQGVMGREYARLDGEKDAVAQAIYEHYMPIRAGGDLPASSIGALLSIADKVDTIVGCFSVGLIPTGGADPFALRRQALGVINIILDRGLRLSLADLVDKAIEGLSEWIKRPVDEVKSDVMEFFRLRLKNQLTGQGVSTDGAEAVLALFNDDYVSAVNRVKALEDIKTREDFNDLAVAFKRVVNIIRKFGAQDGFDNGKIAADQEKALADAVEVVEQKAERQLQHDDYSALLADIVELKPVVDGFFDHVLVDDPDPEIKANRLALLTRVSRLFDQIADFTKIST